MGRRRSTSRLQRALGLPRTAWDELLGLLGVALVFLAFLWLAGLFWGLWGWR
jgi:hypothetical protein